MEAQFADAQVLGVKMKCNWCDEVIGKNASVYTNELLDNDETFDCLECLQERLSDFNNKPYPNEPDPDDEDYEDEEEEESTP